MRLGFIVMRWCGWLIAVIEKFVRVIEMLTRVIEWFVTVGKLVVKVSVALARVDPPSPPDLLNSISAPPPVVPPSHSPPPSLQHSYLFPRDTAFPAQPSPPSTPIIVHPSITITQSSPRSSVSTSSITLQRRCSSC